MPATSDPRSSASDGRPQNLFVEADPEFEAAPAPPSSSSSADPSTTRPPRRVRGLVVPVDAHSTEQSPGRPDAVQLVRRDTALGHLRAVVGRGLRQADVACGRLLARVASRRYGALALATVVPGLIVAFAWLGLAARDSSPARVALEQRLAREAPSLRQDKARIASLSTKLQATTLAARRPPTIAMASGNRVPPDRHQATRLRRPHRRRQSR